MTKLMRNIAALLTSDMLNRITTFGIYALVARYLGELQFGQLSLGLLLFYTFYIFAGLGLRTFIAREVARDPAQTDRYLLNGSLAVLIAGTLAVGTLLLFVRLMGYAADTATVIVLLGLGIVPYALTIVCEAIFQAHERMQFIAFANIPHNLVKVGGAFALLHLGYGVQALALLLAASYLLTLLLEWIAMLACVTRPRLVLDIPFIRSIVQRTLPFLGLEGVIAIWSSMNAVLLSRLIGEVEVGYYNASMQVLVPVSIAFYSLVQSIYPMMCRRFAVGIQGLQVVYTNLVELTLMIALPAAVGLTLLAEPILLLLYGNASFADAVPVLQIVAWALLPIALSRVLGQVLLASLNERTTLRIVVLNTSISLVLGWLLISWLGLYGAALALLLTRLIDAAQHYGAVSRVLAPIPVLRLVWKPLCASSVMAVFLLFVGPHWPLLVSIPAAALGYGAALFGLLLWANGGLPQIRERYGLAGTE